MDDRFLRRAAKREITMRRRLSCRAWPGRMSLDTCEPGRVRCFMLELPFMLGPARVGGRSREIVEGPGKEYLRRSSGASIEPREN